MLFRGCLFWNCPPRRSFTVFNLDLPASIFPENSAKSPLHQPSELSGAQDAAISTIFWNNGQGSAAYNVSRFGTEEKASARFHRSWNFAPYPLHGNLTYRSQVADDFAIGCGNSPFGGYACMVVSRYEEFVLSFHAYMDDEAMTIERFQEIVIFIDQQMADRMQQSGDE
jgi:hypothetical protein